MDYFDDVFHTFLCLDSGIYLAVNVTWQSMGQSQTSPGFHQKYLKLCSEHKQSFYGFETTWELVINDKHFILGWSNPLINSKLETKCIVK